MSAGPDQFAETKALVAQMEDDEDGVYEVLLNMLPTELNSLAQVCDELAENARFVMRKKRQESQG